MEAKKDIYTAAVAEVLGKPVGFEISEPAARVRKTLLAVALALVCVVVAEIEPENTFTIFGVALKGVTPDKIVFGGVIVLTFTLIHFVVYITELVMEWRVRVTGTHTAFQPGQSNNQEADYHVDPRQSTLYGWWLGRSKRLQVIEELAHKITSDLEEIKQHYGRPTDYPDETNYGDASILVDRLTGDLRMLTEELGEHRGIVISRRIDVSLRRFEGWFEIFLGLQSSRVIIMEVAIPIALGFFSLGCAVKYILAN